MSILLGELPDCVEYGGRKYGVYTDFRNWIGFFRAAEKRDIAGMLKVYRELPPNAGTAIELAADFGNRGALPYGGGGQRKVLDYERDAQLIYAAFMGEYKIDLCEARLHWYKFCALLAGLGESRRIVQIMGIRSMKAGNISDSGRRREIQELQRRYAVADTRTVKERDTDISRCLAEFY